MKKQPKSKPAGEAIRALGQTIFRKGLPKIGGALIRAGGAALRHTPVGGVLDEIGVLDAVGEALGVGNEVKAIEQAVEKMTPGQLQALTRLRELESEIALAELEAGSRAVETDTHRIQSVNETMRAEVLGNPEAGAWRPLWGRVSCWGYWFFVAVLSFILGWAVVSEQYEVLAQMPALIGALSTLMLLPAAILGVASYHRGKEKVALAVSSVISNQ